MLLLDAKQEKKRKKENKPTKENNKRLTLNC